MTTALDRSTLEAEREFLLKSIADLDAEHAAGDLNEADHRALRDDYVARAAAVMRALDALVAPAVDGVADQPHLETSGGSLGVVAAPSPTKVQRTRRSRAPLVIVGCVSLSLVAGISLAHSSGSRPVGAPLTGSLPASVDEQLQKAAAYLGDGKAVDAIKVYDTILKKNPNQVVALAYRGWLVRLAGLRDEGLGYENRAVAADVAYPDAHFFRGMMLWEDKKDPTAAVAEFRLFLANRPPQAMVPLVEDALTRASAEAGIPAQ